MLKESILVNCLALLLTTTLLFGCMWKETKQDNSISGLNADEAIPDIEEPPVIKDSIDILIEERAEQEFNSTIFAGLRFGSKKQLVEKTLNNKKHSTEIPILVPIGDNVKKVIIRDYDAIFYNDQLASLVLYANEADLIEALYSQYSKKYGETKNNEWRYSNCEIIVERRVRKEHRPDFIANYLTYVPQYYTSYRGEVTTHLTKEPFFLIISYRNFTLLRLLERQQYVKDSLDRARLLLEAQKEKELARKLENEVPTNI